ncbi:MAG: hypothetical protein AAFO03_23365, partial [Bacteroidota bacterium]
DRIEFDVRILIFHLSGIVRARRRPFAPNTHLPIKHPSPTKISINSQPDLPIFAAPNQNRSYA